MSKERYDPARDHEPARVVRLICDANQAPAVDDAAKKPASLFAVVSGASSGKKCPPSTGSPVTLSAHARQIASGPPSAAYQTLSAPWPLHSARTGHVIRRPARDFAAEHFETMAFDFDEFGAR